MDPRFPAGLPFPVPEILVFVAFGDSGKIFQQFSRKFSETFLQNSRKDPRNSHSLLEFSEECVMLGKVCKNPEVCTKKMEQAASRRQPQYSRDLPDYNPETLRKSGMQKGVITKGVAGGISRISTFSRISLENGRIPICFPRTGVSILRISAISKFSRAPLPPIPSETWLVHAKSSRSTSEPPGSYELSTSRPCLTGKTRKVHTNRGIQMWFANIRANHPCSDWILGRGADSTAGNFQIAILGARKRSQSTQNL